MKNIKLLLIAGFISQLSFGQKALSAKDAVFQALANNYQIQIAHLQVDVAEKSNSWAGAGLFPTVQLAVGFSNGIQDNRNNPFTFTPGIIVSHTLNPNLNLNWNIFSGFLVRISKERLGILEEQSKGNALLLIENTTQDVIEAYYSAQLQRQRMLLFKDVMAISSKRKRLYELKEKYAASSGLEMLQFKNQYLTDSTNFLLQDISYKNSVRNLFILMNGADSSINVGNIVLTDSLNFEFPLLNMEEIITKMLASNQNLKNQYLSLELQKKQTELQKSFLYPTLSLSAGVTPNYSWLSDMKNPNFNARTEVIQYFGNLNVRYTLFDNWNNQRNIQVSRIQEEIANLNVSSLEQTLRASITNLLEVYNLRSDLLSISEENLEYATKAWTLAQKRFENGTISSIDLSTFQSNYQNTLIQHYQNHYNKLETYLEIFRMTGNLGLEFMR